VVGGGGGAQCVEGMIDTTRKWTPGVQEGAMYTQSTGPRSIGGVLDDGVRLYRESFRQIWPLLIVNAILAVAPSLVLGLNRTVPGSLQQAQAFYQTMLSPSYWIGFLILILANLVIYGALLGSIDSVAKGGGMALGEALQLGLSRLARLFGAAILFGLAAAIGILLFIIPGIYLIGIFQLVFVAIVLENARIGAAFGISRRLIKGHWWRSVTIVSVAIIILLVLSFLGTLVTALAAVLRPSVGTVLIANQVVSLVLNVIIVGWMPSVLLAMFYDLKLRHEGGDLSARVDALAAR
jgi:hypothetical protein